MFTHMFIFHSFFMLHSRSPINNCALCNEAGNAKETEISSINNSFAIESFGNDSDWNWKELGIRDEVWLT